jgi:hypothetical protein
MFVEMRSLIGLRGLIIAASLVRRIIADSVWDYAPDLSKSNAPPYPPLTNPDGSNITIENLRGTHLFGFDGCGGSQQKATIQAYEDFHTIMNMPGIYNNIDWDDVVTKDFFGAACGKYKIPHDRRKQIQRKGARPS